MRLHTVRMAAALAIPVLLSGCFAHNVSKDFAFKPDAKTGLVFASVTASGAVPSTLWFQYRKVGEAHSDDEQIPVINEFVEMDWKPVPVHGVLPVDNPIGRLVAIELPPGQYEFYAWYGNIPGFNVRSVRPFSFKFEAVAGRAVYVGNIHLYLAGTRYRMVVQDKRERDLPLIHQKVPKVTEEQTETHLMEHTG